MPTHTHHIYRKEGRKCFPGMRHSTPFIYGYITLDIRTTLRGNPLLPLHGVLFPISNKGSCLCIIPHRGQDIPWCLLYEIKNTGWNEEQLNGSTIRGRSDNPSHHDWMCYQGAMSWFQALINVCHYYVLDSHTL